MSELPKIKDFPHHLNHQLRYSDTDRQGHVNNAVFAVFIEMGRVDIIYRAKNPLHGADANYVLANLELNYHAELNWPAEIVIATRISKIGNSSVTFEHGVFQDDACLATGRSVCVHFDTNTRKSTPLTDDIRTELEKYQ